MVPTNITKKTRYLLFFVIALLLQSVNSSAQQFHFVTDEFSDTATARALITHAQSNPSYPDTLIAEHDKFSTDGGTSGWRSDYKFKSVNAFVKFYIDHSDTLLPGYPYTYKLVYNVRGYKDMVDTAHQIDQFTDTLVISYDSDSLTPYQDIQVKKYPGYHKILVEITGIYDVTSNPASLPPSPLSLDTLTIKNFGIEASVRNQVYFLSNYGSGATLTSVNKTTPVVNDFLEIIWSPTGTNSPSSYELEWTYVDDYGIDTITVDSATELQKTTSDLRYDFKHNCTRVWTKTNSYKIPLIYQRGYVVYRVRMVRPDSTLYKVPVYGQWTVTSDTGTVASLSGTHYYEIINAHLNDSTNWQYTVSFAEEGKYKHVMSYYDGLLKNRQTITRFNSDPEELIVTENVLDHEGKPVIKILPTPVSSESFTYQHNVSLNSVTALPYKAADFDTIRTETCPGEDTLSPLHSNALANIYYSSGNPDQSGLQKFVPDAGGYPLVQTVYAPGYKDRIEKQGGAGTALQLVYEHVTENEYVNADQMDLNRHFGTDIGLGGFYGKTVSRDPNGQISMSVQDYKGRHVMSSIIGTGPDSVSHAIVPNPNIPDTTMWEQDVLASVPQQIVNNHRVSNSSFYMDRESNSFVEYEYIFNGYPLGCANKYLSIAASYEYSIIDKCGELRIDTSGILGYTGVVDTAVDSYPQGRVSVFLEKGKHILNKRLTVNLDDIDVAVDSFLADPDTCLKTEPEFIKEEVLERTFPCNDIDDPCGKYKRQMMDELYPGNKYGQYTLSGGGIVLTNTGTSIFDFYDNHFRYQDTCLDSIVINHFGSIFSIRNIDPVTLIKAFNDDIAEALLPLHPEYCKLLACFTDTFKTQLEAIPNAKIAEKRNLLILDSIIAADPIVSRLSISPLSFASPEDSLATFSGGVVRFDTLMTLYAYCGCTDTVMYKECVQKIFSGEINMLDLTNDQVKETYFKSLIPIYLQNRERFKKMMIDLADSTCSPCPGTPTERMYLIPEPVFPKMFADSTGSYDTSNSSFWGQFNNLSNPSVDSIIKMMKDIISKPHDSLYAYNDSANNIFSANNSLLCTGQVDSIVARLTNCFGGNTALIDSVKSDLLDLCANGQVQFGNYSPQQIRDVLVDNGISLGDLCNPYLVNYDKFPMGDRTTEVGLSCKNTEYYTSQKLFFNNGNVIDAYKNLGTEYTVTLNPSTSAFDDEINTLLSASSSVLVTVSFTSGDNFYKLKVYKTGGTDTLDIYLRGSGSGASSQCNNIFDTPGTDVFTFTDVKCIKSSGASLGPGYISNFSFVATVERQGSSQTTSCSLLGWTNSLELAEYSASKIVDCVPCTEMRSLYSEFADTLNVYGVKGVDHPYYSTMLRTFMSYRLGKSYTTSRYERFIESCALADSMYMKRYVGYAHLTFNDSTDAANFISAINGIDQTVSFTYPYIEDDTIVVLDFRHVPKPLLQTFKDSISNYTTGVTDKQVNELLQVNQNSNRVGFIYTPDDYSFTPNWSTILGGTLSGKFSFGSVATKVINIGGVEVSCNVYTIDKRDTTSEYEVSRAVEKLYHYINDSILPVIFASNYQHTVDADYYTSEKQAFLGYVYGFQGAPSNNVVDSLQAEYINQVSPFTSKPATYTIPSNPANTTNLYVTDGSTSPLYNTLAYILDTVSTQNSGQIFFLNNTTQIISSNNTLTAYRCSDGSYWYRYFGAGDTMYNVFLKMPEYLGKSEQTAYKLLDTSYLRPEPGDSTTRNFSVTLINSNTSDTITVYGMTNFVVGSNLTLEDVLLGDPVTAKRQAPDTFNNCERYRIRSAVDEGKMRYAFYIDSVRQSLRVKFRAHVMQNIEERLLVGYVDQRFQTTLYYYDRAGNLVKTVPPEGVQKYGGNNNINNDRQYTDSVDDKRSAKEHFVPDHKKESKYHYNTLNQLVWQYTPDGGEVKFYYDAAGRLLFSQNEKQRIGGYFTYNLYDKQSRVIETGETVLGCSDYFPPNDTLDTTNTSYTCWYYDAKKAVYTSEYPQVFNRYDITHDSLVKFIRSKARRDVVLTTYDTASLFMTGPANSIVELDAFAGMSGQQNLRKRVSSTKYFRYLSVLDTMYINYDHASYYSYDALGNVKTLTHDFPVLKGINQRMKRIDYDYDLISGKVNMLSYNRGFADQYYQRYAYDDDNRILKVETSADGYLWMRDAEYEYYKHGPLARLSLGDLHVQGLDYAYTVQGWLKAINGDILQADKDMGKYAYNASIHSGDVAAMTLEYFSNDYAPIGSQQVEFLPDSNKALYNGNIAGKKMSIRPFDDLNTKYIYDQLNRIHRADYHSIDAVNQTLSGIDDYMSRHFYDQDGNITKLTRRGNSPGNTIGGTTQMLDTLDYIYDASERNRLNDVTDNSNHTYTGLQDIEYYTSTSNSRYLYDEIGNTVKDLVSGQDTIKWNLYNKVTETKDTTDKSTLDFYYDAQGNRTAKEYVKQTDTNYRQQNTYYVRDAQGNILATYKRESAYKWTKMEWLTAIYTDYKGQLGRPSYLQEIVDVHYSGDPDFGSTMAAYVATTYPTWIEGEVSSRDVSFFLEKNGILDRMLTGTTNYLDPLYTYTDSESIPIIADAWKSMFAGNVTSELEDWTEALFANPDDPSRTHLFELICDADIYNQMIPDLETWYNVDNLGTCYDKATDIAAAVDAANDYDQLAGYMASLYANYTNEFKSFLEALAADDAVMNDSYYMNQAGGTLVAVLQDNLDKYGNTFDLETFFNGWEDAPTELNSIVETDEFSEILYNDDPLTFLLDYTGDNDDDVGFNVALAAVPGIELTSYLDLVDATVSSYDATQVEIALNQIKQIEYDRYYLAEHHLYGSSRLGTKDYWKDQVNITWDVSQSSTDPVVDSTRMGAKKPWYSAQYQDFITNGKTEPYGNTDATVASMEHLIGTKQLEVTNHLGNVQATVSDKRRGIDTNSNGGIDLYRADIPAAYDYYPFGMLMPGRYTHDTNQHCAWVTQTKLMPQWGLGDVDISYPASATTWTAVGTASLIVTDGAEPELEVETTETDAGMESPGETVDAGYKYEVIVDVSAMTGDWELLVEQKVSSQWQLLENETVAGTGEMILSVSPAVSDMKIRFANKSTGGTSSIAVKAYHYNKLYYVPQNVLVQVCSDADDKYRFGFNGQEKDNEIAGIGNHNTALFWQYDTRTGRRWNLDPVDQVSISNYATFANNPIIMTDFLGDKVKYGSKEVRADVKYLRKNDAAFAAKFKSWKKEYRGKNDLLIRRSNNGTGTLDEASITGGFNGSKGADNNTDHLDYTAIRGAHQGEYSILNVGFSNTQPSYFNVPFNSTLNVNRSINAPSNIANNFSHWDLLEEDKVFTESGSETIGQLRIMDPNSPNTKLTGTIIDRDTHPLGSYLDGRAPSSGYGVMLRASSNKTLMKVPRSSSGVYLWNRATKLSNSNYSDLQKLGITSEDYYREVKSGFSIEGYLNDLKTK